MLPSYHLTYGSWDRLQLQPPHDSDKDKQKKDGWCALTYVE